MESDPTSSPRSSSIPYDSDESDTESEDEPRSKRLRISIGRAARGRTRSPSTSTSRTSTGSGTATGRFKKSWNLQFIEASAKTNKFAYCKLCHREFSVAHGGYNDAKRHCASVGHQKRCSESTSTSTITNWTPEFLMHLK